MLGPAGTIFNGMQVCRDALRCLCCRARPGRIARRELFPRAYIAAHSAERMQVECRRLGWDPALANGAALYAQQLAFTGVRALRPLEAPRHRRNLWMGSHGYFSVEVMVGGWSSEKR